MEKSNKIPWSYVIELYELQLFLGCDTEELMGRMFTTNRFKINQYKFSNSLKL